jgi:hypothetical protein
MSLALALLINVFAMLALIAGLAYVMSRAALLAPHDGQDDLSPSPELERSPSSPKAPATRTWRPLPGVRSAGQTARRR